MNARWTLPAVVPALAGLPPAAAISPPTIDPAAETELSLILTQCGFTLASDKSDTKPDIELVGEAFSEFGMRKGNLVSCKARVELKALEKVTGKRVADTFYFLS